MKRLKKIAETNKNYVIQDAIYEVDELLNDNMDLELKDLSVTVDHLITDVIPVLDESKDSKLIHRITGIKDIIDGKSHVQESDDEKFETCMLLFDYILNGLYEIKKAN